MGTSDKQPEIVINKPNAEALQALEAEKAIRVAETKKDSIINILQMQNLENSPAISQSIDNYIKILEGSDETAKKHIIDQISSLPRTEKMSIGLYGLPPYKEFLQETLKELKDFRFKNSLNNPTTNEKLQTVLGKEKNISVQEIFEKEKAFISKYLKQSILRDLQKDPYLSKDSKLNETGVKVMEQIEKSLTPERLNNISFGFLDMLLKKTVAKINTTPGNKEIELTNKTNIMLTLQQFFNSGSAKEDNKNTPTNGNEKQKGELLQKLLGSLQSSNELTSLQTNLTVFLRAKLKEGGLDTQSKETRRESIINGSEFSKFGLVLSKNKQNQAILDVVPGAFEHAFSYFNNQSSTEKVINALVNYDGGKGFNADSVEASLLKSTIDQPSNEAIQALHKNIETLLKDIPTDEKGKDQLKTKIAYKKFDGLLNGLDKMLGQFGMSDMKGTILSWLDSFKDTIIGKWIFGLFKKNFGLKDSDMDKLFERPHIGSGIKNYESTLQENQKKINWNYKDSKHLKIDESKPWTDTTSKSPTYFTLQNNLVYTKVGEQNEKNIWEVKRVDAGGKLTDLKENDPDITKYDLTYDKITNKVDLPLAQSGHIEHFIARDIHIDSIILALSSTYESKDKGFKVAEPHKKIQALLGIITGEKPEIATEEKAKAKIEEKLKKIITENPYVYSTQELIGLLLEDIVLEDTARRKTAKKETTPNQVNQNTPNGQVDNTTTNSTATQNTNTPQNKQENADNTTTVKSQNTKANEKTTNQTTNSTATPTKPAPQA